MDLFKDFLAGRHPRTVELSRGEVRYLNFKDKEIVQPAVLLRGYPYDQEWAWAVDEKGKVSAIHPQFYTVKP